MAMDPDRDPWERQAGESVKQHARLLIFRDLGRVRNLKHLVHTLNTMGDRVGYRTLQQTSWEYRWVERAQAWDVEQDKTGREQLAQDRKDMVKRHRQVAGALLTKAIKALTAMSTEDLNAADIARFVKLATDVERTALALPNETVALVGADGGPVRTEDLTGLTGEERRQRLGEIVEELARRVGTTRDDDDE